jgi:hypothetical protein
MMNLPKQEGSFCFAFQCKPTRLKIQDFTQKPAEAKARHNRNQGLKSACENASTEGTKNITKKFKNLHFGFFNYCRFYAFTARTLIVCDFAFPNFQNCTSQTLSPT